MERLTEGGQKGEQFTTWSGMWSVLSRMPQETEHPLKTARQSKYRGTVQITSVHLSAYNLFCLCVMTGQSLQLRLN